MELWTPQPATYAFCETQDGMDADIFRLPRTVETIPTMELWTPQHLTHAFCETHELNQSSLYLIIC